MTEQLVVDANVVAKLYLRDEEYTANTDLLFTRFAEGQVSLFAPNLITYEIPECIRKGVGRRAVDKQTWQDALKSFESLGLLIMDDSGAKHEALRLAVDYSCTFYDALYLVLAEDLECRFITADGRLYSRLYKRMPFLLFLASYK